MESFSNNDEYGSQNVTCCCFIIYLFYWFIFFTNLVAIIPFVAK